MSRLAERIEVTIGGQPVELRPTLRAALRLAREPNGFKGLLLGASEGSLTVLARIVRECLPDRHRSTLPHDLFSTARPLAWTIAEYRFAAFALVAAFLAAPSDDEPEKPAAKRQPDAKPFDAVRYFEDLFGFATGILKWTRDDAWNATPGEIRAAVAFRERVYAPKKDAKASRPHNELTLDEQAFKFAAQLMNRAPPSDAE